MKWNDYLNDRLIAKHPNGFSIIVQKSQSKSTPIFCPTCHFIMNSYYDVMSYNEWECCEKCSDKWIRTDKQKWSNGWRPTREELKAEVQKRKQVVI